MRFIETWTPATLVSTRDLAPGIREFLILPDRFDGTAYPVGSHINVSMTINGQAMAYGLNAPNVLADMNSNASFAASLVQQRKADAQMASDYAMSVAGLH